MLLQHNFNLVSVYFISHLLNLTAYHFKSDQDQYEILEPLLFSFLGLQNILKIKFDYTREMAGLAP
jgi:hypothetical protein